MDDHSDAEYGRLLDRIEAGDVRAIPGTIRRGEAAAQLGQSLLMEYTGMDNVQDAVHVALGRPTKTAVPTTVIKAAVPEPMAERVRNLALRENVSAAQVLRVATAEYLDRMAA